MPSWYNYDSWGGGGGTTGGQPTQAPGGNISPAPASNWSAGYGGIPWVPDPVASAGGAATGTTGNLSSIYGLLGPANQFNQGQLTAGYQAAIPGYRNLTRQSSLNIGANLRGQVNPDVLNNIIDTAAERGIMTGSPGGPGSNAAMLRALGLTTMGLQQLGDQQLTASIGRAPVAPPINAATYFTSPGDVQSARTAANIYGSAPVPSAAAGVGMAAARQGFNLGRGTPFTMGAGGGGGGLPPTPSSFWRWASDVPSDFAYGPGATATGTSAPRAWYDNTTWQQAANNVPGALNQTGPPANTVNTPWQSSNDPYAAYGGYNFSLPMSVGQDQSTPDPAYANEGYDY